MKRADLHIHTKISDGKISPSEAVLLASKSKIDAISIADHDSVEGVEEAIKAGKVYGVEVIPGVELSSEVPGRELHVLGYFVDWRKAWFKRRLAEFQEARRNRAGKILEKLRGLGIEIPYDTLLELDGRVVGRPHIAQAMVDLGYARSMDEAFDRFLGRGKPAYVEKFPLSPEQAIKLIRRAGGVPVLAHPIFARADDMLPELVEKGLAGIEAYHTKHNSQMTAHYEELARKYGLIATGGSDAHGWEGAVGSICVPYSCVEELKRVISPRVEELLE